MKKSYRLAEFFCFGALISAMSLGVVKCASVTPATLTAAEAAADAACILAKQDLPSSQAIQVACALPDELIPLIETILGAVGKGKSGAKDAGGQ